MTDTATTTDGWPRRIAFTAIALGAAVRVWVFAQRGSLWLDEASLALNVLSRGFAGLAHPLAWGQAAPVGFLWVQKALTLAMGPGEWVMRLVPLAAGVATPALAWSAGRRLVGEGAAALATVALATSLLAIRYSAEAKPYASDAAAALALIWLALNVLESPDSKRRWAALRVAGVVAILVSLPSVFVLAAVGLALVPAAWRTNRWTRLVIVAASVEWLATFAILWFAVVRTASSGAYLREYWAPVMLDPHAADLWARFVRAVASAVVTPLQWTGSVTIALWAMLATAVGVVMLTRRSWRATVLLAGPFVAAAVASVAGVYPLSDRLAFFTSPVLMMVAAIPVAFVAGSLGESARLGPARAIGIVAVTVAVWTATDSWRMVRAPGSLEPTRALFEGVGREAARTRTPVYVYARAVPAWLYETTDWRAAGADARVERYTVASGDVAAAGHENFARTGPVPPGAGDSLVARTPGGGAELIGLAPGVRYRIAGPTSAPRPSDGWTDEEARRIIAAAGDTGHVWIVASHFFEATPRDELAPLIGTLTTKGMTIAELRRGGRDVLALRVGRGR